MKLTTLAPAALLLLAGTAYAQDTGAGGETAADYDAAASEAGTHPDFATADTDKDGLLSIAELQAAMPDVTINDENADGFVNQSEAEASISGLAFESNGFTGGSSLVSEPEYGLIVSQLSEGDSGDAGAVDSGETADESSAADDSLN
jgi:hypothetical protein